MVRTRLSSQQRTLPGRAGAAALLAVLGVIVAGCGGGGSDTSAAETVTVTTTVTMPAETTTTDDSGDASETTETTETAETTTDATAVSQEADCAGLEHIVTDIQFAIGADTGLDYIRDRDFLDEYADRAPDEIADSVDQLRDLFDEFASAAQAVGLEPGETPLPDQADAIAAALDVSSDEQVENQRAITTIDAWTTNECA